VVNTHPVTSFYALCSLGDFTSGILLPQHAGALAYACFVSFVDSLCILFLPLEKYAQRTSYALLKGVTVVTTKLTYFCSAFLVLLHAFSHI
jgi:hypothetical protein